MAINTSGLDRFISKLKKVQNLDNTVCNRIVNDVSDIGADMLRSKYSMLNADDVSHNPIPNVYTQQEANTAQIVAQGQGVAYIEFGTGTIGQNTVDSELNAKKTQLGLSPYNSGSKIRDKIPIWQAKGKYKFVRGWLKPDYALTNNETARYEKWLSGLNLLSADKNGTAFIKRAYKYTHGTQGIPAGQQIFNTARELQKIIPTIASQEISKELNNG